MIKPLPRTGFARPRHRRGYRREPPKTLRGGCFLGTLLSCYRKLDERFAVVQDAKTTKKERVELMVSNALFPLSKREIAEALPDVSPTTVEAVLGKMVREGRAQKIGSYRNARYIGAH